LKVVKQYKVSNWKIFRRKNNTHDVNNSSNKLLYVESIRGIAAIIVVFAHLRTAFFPYPTVIEGALSPGSPIINQLFYGLPFGWIVSGHFAVVIFFVLSGYVLTYRYFETFALSDLQKQGAKRFLRLAIPVFTTVMLSYFMYSTGMMANSAELARITGDMGIAGNFTFTPNFNNALYDATIGVFVNRSSMYNPVLWTMSIELVGSFLIFGLAALLSNNKYRWIFYIVAILLLSQTYYVGFILGLLLADAVHNTKMIEQSKKYLNKGYITIGIVLVILLISSESMIGVSGPFHIIGMDGTTTVKMWHLLAAFLLLWLTISSEGLQRFFSFKPFVILGSLSFSIYLLHYLILFSLGSWVFVSFWKVGSGLYISSLIASLSVLAVTFTASIFWKRYVDDASVIASRALASIVLKK
jgi:peptidoglycan/LPS O-acetylase OafA/YrhL